MNIFAQMRIKQSKRSISLSQQSQVLYSGSDEHRPASKAQNLHHRHRVSEYSSKEKDLVIEIILLNFARARFDDQINSDLINGWAKQYHKLRQWYLKPYVWDIGKKTRRRLHGAT